MNTYPLKRKRAMSIAIPASLVTDIPHLREKTLRVGMVARAAAIFRVEKIFIYQDICKSQKGDANFIKGILAYLATPQYLRRKAFGLSPILRFAAVLPPLRTPNHPLENKLEHLNDGEYRDALVIRTIGENCLVDVGVEAAVPCKDINPKPGALITVQVRKVSGKVEAERVDPATIPRYWVYTVGEERSLTHLLKTSAARTTIATSRKGDGFSKVQADIEQRLTAEDCMIVFGSPSRGLFEIAKDEGHNLRDLVDFVVNTIPNQGTATVRSEEAILATLALFTCFTET